MILHMGVRTTEPTLVAHTAIWEGEDEASALARLLSAINRKGAETAGPSMIVFHGPPSAPNPRREVLGAVAYEVEDVPTMTLPPARVAFLVFTGADSERGAHYRRLRRYVEERGLEPSPRVHRIEALYAPSDPDEDDWRTEIMIPLAG